MLFGLTDAFHIFQQYLKMLLKLVQDTLAVYLDDILIHSDTVQGALQELI